MTDPNVPIDPNTNQPFEDTPDTTGTDELPEGATVDDVKAFLAEAGDDPAERERRAGVAENFENAQEGENRKGVTDAIAQARQA